MSVQARSRPYAEPPPNTYYCKRCGTPRSSSQRTGATGYCKDCEHYARADGWLPPRKPRTTRGRPSTI